MKSKIFSGIFCLALRLAIITFSIGLPIYFRPFYYLQIDALDIPETSGYSFETIKGAYDSVLDYLTIPGTEFSVGELEYSLAGKSHFEDCKVLFDLNITVFAISLILVTVILILKKRGKVEFLRPKGYNLFFKSGVINLLVFATGGILVALNFSGAFDLFHEIFFMGKNNWYFGTKSDPVINILPTEFFSNAAILIFSSICILSIGCIIFGIIDKKKKQGF